MAAAREDGAAVEGAGGPDGKGGGAIVKGCLGEEAPAEVLREEERMSEASWEMVEGTGDEGGVLEVEREEGREERGRGLVPGVVHGLRRMFS